MGPQPITGTGPVLGGRLRFYDPTIGEYLRSLGEAEAERDAAQVRAAEAEAELQRLRQQLESQPE